MNFREELVELVVNKESSFVNDSSFSFLNVSVLTVSRNAATDKALLVSSTLDKISSRYFAAIINNSASPSMLSFSISKDRR